jgi:hypothetical protein
MLQGVSFVRQKNIAYNISGITYLLHHYVRNRTRCHDQIDHLIENYLRDLNLHYSFHLGQKKNLTGYHLESHHLFPGFAHLNLQNCVRFHLENPFQNHFFHFEICHFEIPLVENRLVHLFVEFVRLNLVNRVENPESPYQICLVPDFFGPDFFDCP